MGQARHSSVPHYHLREEGRSRISRCGRPGPPSPSFLHTWPVRWTLTFFLRPPLLWIPGPHITYGQSHPDSSSSRALVL